MYNGDGKVANLYEIKLNFEELGMIDGKVSEEAQKVIEKAKKEMSYGFSLPLVNEVLRRSEERGEFTWKYKQIRSCSHCEKKHDYYTYPRNGRYHNKGDKNYDKPKYYSGIEFNPGFINMVGMGDICGECCDKYNITNQIIDYILDNDLKIQIQHNDYRSSRYLKDDIRICWNCNEEMRESEMGKEPAVMSGYFPSKCPKCDAKSSAFGNSHKTTNKFDFIRNPASLVEIVSIKAAVKEFNNKIEDDKKKIGLFNSKERTEVFFVKLSEGHYGGRITIDTKNKLFYTHKDFREFATYLDGYDETEDQYFHMKFN